jgi:hypothetical protein
MSDVIRLVKGDELPVIILTLTDDQTNAALDLTNSTVAIKFRAVGTTTVLSTITCAKTNDPGTDGKVQFDFSNGVLDVDEGMYEGEIKITENNKLHTVYDVLKFRVRSNF